MASTAGKPTTRPWSRGVWAGAVLLAGALPTQGVAQDAAAPARTIVVQGEVLDATTRLPVALALVELVCAQQRALTDSLGYFRFEGVEEGGHQVRVSGLGYITLSETTPLGADEVVTVWLTPKAISLEGLQVTVNRLARRRRAFPRAVRALSAAEIQMSPALDAFDLLERIPGARTVPCGASECVLRRGRYTPLRVMMDEMPLPGGALSLQGYPSSEIHAVEFVPSCSMVRVYTTRFVERMARIRSAFFLDLCQTF